MTDTNQTNNATSTGTGGKQADPPPDYSNMQHHQLAELFPEMSENEFTTLKEDIKVNGLRVPITTLDDKILDGRNRYKACLANGYKLKPTDFTKFEGPRYKALDYVISANVHRRHLNESQRAVIAGKVVTTTLGSNQHSLFGGEITKEKAAKLLGVSETNVTKARNLLDKGSPKVQQAVWTGKKRLNRVKPWLDLPHAEQDVELEKKPAPNQKQSGTKKSEQKEPPANQKMTDVDEFIKKWSIFDVMQKQVFVEKFLDELVSMAQGITEKNAWQQKQVAA